MTEPDNRKNTKKKFNDIFIANSIYPEVNSIFKINKTLQEIKDDCYIVLDTSVLLLPYNAGRESLSQIKKTYKKLLAESRLIIPAQSAREFVKNRANKLLDLYQNLSDKKGIEIKKNTYPLLESLDEYQEILEFEKIIEDSLKEYKNKINKLLKNIENWTWNDPVSLMYGELFNKDVIFDIDINEVEIKKDLERRQEYEIPPGYEDASKPDSGVGDLLIWYSLLQVGKKYKKSVILVSGEKKSDWWHKRGKHALYPRYELVDEFRRYSENQSFHIIELSHLLQLYGASETAIKEIELEEKQVIDFNSIWEFLNEDIFPINKNNNIFINRGSSKGWQYSLKMFIIDNLKTIHKNLEIIEIIKDTFDPIIISTLSYFDTKISSKITIEENNMIIESLKIRREMVSASKILNDANSTISMIVKFGVNELDELNIEERIIGYLEMLQSYIYNAEEVLNQIMMRLTGF
jgi:predicted nucleic acid-binding protein